MDNSLDRLTIRGFKSIWALEDFQLGNLNVFIGGNGAGKSNLLEFFRLLRAVIDGRLNQQVFVEAGDGEDVRFALKVDAVCRRPATYHCAGFHSSVILSLGCWVPSLRSFGMQKMVFPLRLGFPIFQQEIGDSSELAQVVGHQCAVVG